MCVATLGLGLTVNADVDPASWGFKGRELYSRRAYFWTLMSGILWQVSQSRNAF